MNQTDDAAKRAAKQIVARRDGAQDDLFEAKGE